MLLLTPVRLTWVSPAECFGVGRSRLPASLVDILDRAFQPLLYQVQHPPIYDPTSERLEQVSMRDAAEVVRQVGVWSTANSRVTSALHAENSVFRETLTIAGNGNWSSTGRLPWSIQNHVPRTLRSAYRETLKKNFCMRAENSSQASSASAGTRAVLRHQGVPNGIFGVLKRNEMSRLPAVTSKRSPATHKRYGK